MSTWKLSEGRGGASERLTGYAVQDALGVRLGYVSGWLTDPGDQVRMLKIAVTEWDTESEYLVPVGAVTLVSETRSLIQLRDVTKQSIGRLCYRYRGELPEGRVLRALQRHFPAPRPSVLERLEKVTSRSTDPGYSWTRLAEMNFPHGHR